MLGVVVSQQSLKADGSQGSVFDYRNTLNRHIIMSNIESHLTPWAEPSSSQSLMYNLLLTNSR